MNQRIFAPLEPVDQLAKAYEAEYLADQGQVLLIDIAGKEYVPAIQFMPDGSINEFVLDIAQEFSSFSKNVDRTHFAFKLFTNFMDESIDITKILPEERMKAAFNAQALGPYQSSITVQATRAQLVQGCEGDAGRAIVVKDLAGKLRHCVSQGEFDIAMSRKFADKYGYTGYIGSARDFRP